MAMTTLWLKVDEGCLVQALRDAEEQLAVGEGEVALDFSSVKRIDAAALRALEELVGQADGKGVKVELRGVSVRVYKVLKLMKLASRFSFVN
jgi:ABC-type transporter Mla MlaB component